MIETYDMITAQQACVLGICEMGKDIGSEWREANSGNGITASNSGEPVTTPEGICDLRVPNTGFNNYVKVIIQMTRKCILLKIDLNRKQNGEPLPG